MLRVEGVPDPVPRAGEVLVRLRAADLNYHDVLLRRSGLEAHTSPGAGPAESWEGDLTARRVVIIRFPSVERAKAWYHSPEYTELREQRLRAASGPLLLTAGLDEP
ncbi:DUF1330 domain-containing protein [Dactylosporangium sp. CA-092794]|uniref:DUF1330 domain-containing protein n=1 Tax=Dactylosporangium sp. CA-092794 TaxID=3239929 RepID=UPI003D8E9E7F